MRGTWQKGHSILPLALTLEPVEATFIGLPVQGPAMEQSVSPWPPADHRDVSKAMEIEKGIRGRTEEHLCMLPFSLV